MEDDLTWLARNAHQWPVGDTLIGRILKDGEFAVVSVAGTPVAFINWFTLDQWLARRAELQNKPSWKDAPEWACYLGQSDEGVWYWFDGEPETNEVHDSGEFWNAPGYTTITDRHGSVLGDWRDTLERRPRDLSEPAVTARLSEATENVLKAVPALMDEKFNIDRNDWFERGELPPVGVECEVLWNDAEWYKTKILAILEIDGFNKCPVFTTEWSDTSFVDCMPHYQSFRPLRSDRDIVIEDLILVSGLRAGGGAKEVAERLYEAGYRKQG